MTGFSIPFCTARRAPTGLRRFRSDVGGAVAIMTAIMLPVLIGGMGLGAETGYWYYQQRMLQHAADIAAHSGGVQMRAGGTTEQIVAAAHGAALASGFPGAPGTIAVNVPPVSGPNAGDANSVEVLLDLTQPRLFSAIFSAQPVDIGARAVIQLTEGSAGCLLALSRTAAGAMTVSGSTSVSLEGCDVASNSNSATSLLMSGSGTLTAGCAQTVGLASTTGGLTLTVCSGVREEAPPVVDPYAGVAEPALSGSCHNKNVGSPNTSTTLTPTENHPSGVKVMRFCNGLAAKGNVTFGPGLYIIEGSNFTFNTGAGDTEFAELGGNGVTFYFTNGGTARLTGNGRLNFSAPTSGPFAGILYFGARNATGVTHQINGTSDSTAQGAAYFPASNVEFSGNSKTTGGCTQVVANTITLTGNSTFRSSCESAGTRRIVTEQLVNIVE